jgi:hypothetical protein
MFVAPTAPPPAISQPAGLAACQFRRDRDHWTGSCGAVFDENPTFTLAPAKAITSGVWKAGARPTAVWAGKLISAGDPDYPVELELYGRSGVLRSEYGWHAVSAFKATASSLSFNLDTTRELAPNALDREILKRADAILTSPAVWNRADNRRCPASATTWSIYCAAERATIEVTGGFHHRRPAMELVREIIEARSKGRPYHHRLMDYNNDPTTTLADLHSLFAEAQARVPD